MHAATARLAAVFLLSGVTVASAQKTPPSAGTTTPVKGNIPAPTRLFAAQTSLSEITLSWFAPFSAGKTSPGNYVVVCQDDRPPRRSQISAPGMPSKTEEQGRLMTYVVRVGREVPHRCSIEIGLSKTNVQTFPFNPVTPTTSALPAPVDVASFVAQQTAAREVTLSWQHSENATAYRIDRRGHDGTKVLCYICPPGNYVDNTVKDREKYIYYIVALGPGGPSGRVSSGEVEIGGAVAATPASGGMGSSMNISAAPAPAAGQITRTTVQDLGITVTQILRIAPGATIPEHHHPVHTETIIVHAGAVEVTLGTSVRTLRAGEVVVLPANTTMSARNTGSAEAQVVVVFSGNGQPGMLMVQGPAH